MQFGVALPNYGPTHLPESMLQVARAAESAGYSSVWTSDHILVPQRFGLVFGRTLEPLVALGYLAGLTQKVTLGTSVVILPQRDPILVAKQVAAIDQLSGGRVILGIGVGWMEEQYRFFRTDFKRRGRMADEWIAVIRSLWKEDPSAFHGEWIHYEDAYFQPKPLQPGGPPIHIGGASDAALRRAATLGDGWHASGLRLEEFKDKVTKLRAWAGERSVTISLRGYVAIGDASAAYRDNSDVLIGGPPSAFVDRLSEYAEAGMDHFVCGFAYQTLIDLLAQLETFAAHVIPAFQKQS